MTKKMTANKAIIIIFIVIALSSIANALIISDGFNGTMDELVIYNKVLTPTEVLEHYKRGILQLNISVRDCPDSGCTGEGENWDKVCTSLPCDISTDVNQSRYFQYRGDFGTFDTSYTPYLLGIDINYVKEMPDADKFTRPETTNFTNLTDLENVENMTLGISSTKVIWLNPVNSTGQNYDNQINMNDGFISVNTNALHPTINSTANITFYNIDCNDFEIYYSSTFNPSRIALVQAGIVVGDENNLGGDCTDNSICTDVSCSNETLNFIALHFDGFGVGVLKWINATPDPANKDETITIETELELGENYTIDDVWVGITPPSLPETNYTMTNTSLEYYHYEYSNNIAGTYDYKVYVNDTIGEIAYKNSTFVIENTLPPKVNLTSPDNNTFGYDQKPTFNWSAVIDEDGDNITYRLHLIRTGCFGLSNCSNPEVDITNINDTNYTLLEYLDLDSPYNWSVTAHDGTDYGLESDIWNYTVYSLIDITLVIGNISVAGLEPGDNESTEDNSPEPFIIQNNGNVYINLSIFAESQLWDLASLGTKYLQFKAGENGSKPGSFNMTLSESDWVNMTNESIHVVANLDFNDTKDYAEIELAVEVPASEPPGVKSINISIQATGTKIG